MDPLMPQVAAGQFVIVSTSIDASLQAFLNKLWNHLWHQWAADLMPTILMLLYYTTINHLWSHLYPHVTSFYKEKKRQTVSIMLLASFSRMLVELMNHLRMNVLSTNI